MLDHAQNFSEVMHGAPLLYNLMLAEQVVEKKASRSIAGASENGRNRSPRASVFWRSGTENVSGKSSVPSIRESRHPLTNSSIAGGIAPWQEMQRGCATVRPRVC
jgi:hypothetical protein